MLKVLFYKEMTSHLALYTHKCVGPQIAFEFGSCVHFLKCIFLTSLLCFGVTLLSAQQAILHNYSVNQGLSQSTVTGIYQDKTGFLWVGTGHGLNRFNGYEFKTYLHTPSNGSISNDVVREIFQNEKGELIISTEDGINILDHQKASFSRLNIPEAVLQTARVVHEDKTFYYILHTTIGLITYDKATGKREIVSKNTLGLGCCISNDRKTLLYANSLGELIIYRIDEHVSEILIDEKLDDAYITNIIQISGNDYLVTGTTGVFIINIQKKTCERFAESIPEGASHAACLDHSGKLWIAIQDKGIYVFSKDRQLINVFGREFRPTALPAISELIIKQLYCDRQNNIWIGTDGHGLVCLQSSNLRFGNVSVAVNEKIADGQSMVRGFVRDKLGRLWIAVYDGIRVFDRNYNPLYTITGWNKQGNHQMHTIIGENENYIIAAGLRDIVRVDVEKMTVEKLNAPSDSHTWTYSCSAHLADGRVVIGGNGGVIQIDGNKRPTFVPSIHGVAAISTLSSGRTLVAIKSEGLYFYESDSLAALTVLNQRLSELGVAQIRCIVESAEGQLWLGTSSGLFKLDQNYNIINVWSLAEGLPDTYINGVIPDREGNVWLSTNQGISCINEIAHSLVNYSFRDGLQSNEFNAGAYYKDSSGDMFFGGISGFNHFDASSLAGNKFNASIVAESFVTGEFLVNTMTTQQDFQLQYQDNGFTFRLCGLDLSDPQFIEYEYLLSGFDPHFHFAGTNREVRYSGLPPGNLAFYARARNAGGIWSDPVLLFNVRIQTPYWKTWWFYTLVIFSAIVLVALIVSFILKARYRRKIIHLTHQKEIEVLRNNISRDIHDEIGSGLTRISLLTDSIAVSEGKKSDKMHSLSETARNLNMNLREVIWSTNPRYDSLEELIVHLREYASEFLDDTGIEVQFDVIHPVSDIILLPLHRRNIFMIAKEALNNVVKHAKAGKVQYSISQVDRYFKLVITDDGGGFYQDEYQKGNGLRGMQKRAAECGMSLSIDSTLGNGTMLILEGYLPTNSTKYVERN